jgi:hypothetical protein
MTPGYYILRADHVAVPVDLLTWARWFDAPTTRRTVARTVDADGVIVSTVFLGLDHAWPRTGPRQIFETLVVGGPCHHTLARYATWAQAEAGHAAMCARVQSKSPSGAPA